MNFNRNGRDGFRNGCKGFVANCLIASIAFKFNL
jgi:hypothetical protein